jgi:hypothetical protein
METISEMIRTVPKSSLKATLIELKTACTAFTIFPVMTHDSRKEPTIHTRGVSFLIAMVIRISTTKSA